jgi:phosphatidylglycerol:prolipoprotein diacylglycerol transferase
MGAILTALVLLVALDVQIEVSLVVITPGLLVAMSVGRVGCFNSSCCGGPPTASRWGVWSINQRVGARRIPTQLLEFALALSQGLGALVAILVHGPAGGALFIAAMATYTPDETRYCASAR